MTTFFWGAPPGAPGNFDNANDWFNTKSQTFGDGIPAEFDIVNVVGAVPILSAPPVLIKIPSGSERTISQLRVLFQSVDEDFVWIEGSLRVLDEVFFENDRGNLRFIGTITLDGMADDPDTENVKEGGLLAGATMDVDYLHIGGPPITSARNVVSIDNKGSLGVVNGAQVTSRHLEVLETGNLAVLAGGAVDVAGPVVIEQSAGAPPVSVDGQGSKLVVHGTSGYGLDVSGLGNLSITAGGTVDVTGKTVLHSGGAPVLVDGAFSNRTIKGSYGLEISGLGSLKITNGGTVDVTGKMVIDQDTFAPTVSVDGVSSALVVHGDLSLDGYLTFTQGARGAAETATVNSTSPSSLIVGDLTGSNNFSLFTATDVNLGDGLGGFGNLVALPNGQVVVKETLTILNPVANATTVSGMLATLGGSIEIGGHTGTAPDTIQIDPAGLTIGLVGHGMVKAGTLQNDGLVGAQGGLLYVDADVAGNGFFLVEAGAALEIDGKFGSTSTVLLSGNASKVVLDNPESFLGVIGALDPGDVIQINDAGSGLGNTVRSAVIASGAGGESLLTVFQDNALFPVTFRIIGNGSLSQSRFEITESADHTTTFLTLTNHGTTTIHDLDSQGKIFREITWGDGQGSADSNVYRDHLGNLVGPVGTSVYAENYIKLDLTNQQVKHFEHGHLDSLGRPLLSVFSPTEALPALGPLALQWLPNLLGTAEFGFHNFLRMLRMPSSFGYSYTDGAGSSIEIDVAKGLGTAFSAFEAIVNSFAGVAAMASEEPAGAAAVASAALTAASSSSGVAGTLVGQSFGLDSTLSFVSITRFDGTVERYGNLHDGTYSVQTIDSLGEPRSGGTVTAATLGQRLKAQHQYVGELGAPLASIDLGGAIRVSSMAPLIGQDGAAVVAPDGAGVVSTDGAGVLEGGSGALFVPTVAELIGQDGAAGVPTDGAGLIPQVVQVVATDGAGVVSTDGAGIVAGGGLNFSHSSGRATPGRYLSDAFVFADANDDGTLNNGEAWSFTDANGRFELFGGFGTLVLTGGVDTGTNLPFTATLTAPLGSTNVSALTTLANGLAVADGNIDGAIDRLQAALGLDGALDFTLIDPIASTENGNAASARIHVEMSKTLDAVLLIGAAFAGMGADQSKAQDAAFAAMVAAIDKNNALNLTDKGTVSALITTVGASLAIDGSKIADALAGTIMSTGLLIDKLLVDQGAGTGLTSGITTVEAGVQGGLVSSFKAAAGDPNKLGPAVVQLQADSDDGKSVVTPGRVVTITVTTSEAVTVTGAPTLQLSNGKAATFVGGSGGSSLIFKYEAQAGDGAGALAVGGLALGAGASIEDGSGNALSGSVSGGLGLALDTGALVSVAFAEAVKAEGSGGGTTPFTVILTRTGDTSVAHSIAWSLAGPGLFGADPEDFAGGSLPSGGVVTFTAGETSQTIIVEIVADSEVEIDETFQIYLTAPSLGLAIGEGLAIGTIRNDDARVSIAAQSAVQAEGNSGQATFTFFLTREGDLSATHSFAYAVSGSGAVAATAGDFVGQGLPAGRVTFVPNQPAAAITIAVSGDTTVEADEGFTVTLSDPSLGLVLGTASAAVTIQNDDGAVVSIETLSAQKAEQDSGTTPFTFIVRLGEESAVPQSVDWSVTGTGEHPADGADFEGGVLPSGTVSFAPGETGKLVTLAVSGDRAVEFDDFFVVTLSNPSNGLSLATASAIGIVQNDDRATVSIAALSAGKPEGDVGTTPFTFTLSRDQASAFDQGVGWTVTGSGGQAADAADFGGALPAGTVSFAPGETSKTITVAVSGDRLVEPDEEFTITLVDPSAGLVPGTASAVGTIEGDDSVTVSLAAVSAVKPEGNGGSTAYSFTVSLSQAGTTGMTVDWAVGGSGQTPAAAADFGGTLPSGTVSFAAGETSRAIAVNVSGDTVVELDEEFTVNLSNPSSGSLAGGAATGTIQNDDRSTVSIAAQSAVKAEGNGGTTASTFVISLSQAGVTAQTVSWAVAGAGTNAAGAADFAGGALPGGIVTFAAGETSKVVTVSIAGDATVEPDEGYGVTLSGLSAGLVAGVASAAGTIQNDDVAVAVAAHNDAYVVLRGQPLTATASVLSNDVAGATATLLSGPAHGTLQLAGNGTFTYAAAAGFVGIDSFTYRAGNGGSTDDGQVHVHVVPVNSGAATTLGLLTLTAEEQIASTYTAFFGRAADMGGFGFWVGEFVRLLPTQGATSLFANIASSFGISEEAKALYPFLANPFGASDGQISAFLNSVYNNLFNRSSDAGGLGYWTDQVKQTLQAGQFVGSILVNIMGGAQDTAAGKDITTLMGKVAVSLAFVREQVEHGTVWEGASDIAAATTLLQAVTADPQTVLVGVRNAETVIAAHI